VEETVEELSLKIALFGEGGVGKTSMLSALQNKPVQDSYLPTIGSQVQREEYFIKKLNINVKINIWDIGGQRSFNLLNPSTFSNVDAAFLVFDLSKPKETLQAITDVYVENLSKYSEDCFKIIIGNKLDLIEDDQELVDIIEENFSSWDKILLVSAKTGDNLRESFELLIYSFLKTGSKNFPGINFNVISREFVKIIGKTEDKIEKLYVSTSNIPSVGKGKGVKKGAPKSAEASGKMGEDIVDHDIIHEELKKIDNQKEKIIDEFRTNLTEVLELVDYLKKSPSDSVKESLEVFKDQLFSMKKNFQMGIASMTNLNKEEEFVLTVKSTSSTSVEKKVKTEKESITENELYHIFEKENPNKKALWHGNETKAFIGWKNNYLEKIKSIIGK